MPDKIFNKGGFEYISALINNAVADSSRQAVVNGNWEIDNAIRIPSDFTLILDSCHLKMADGCYSNLFVNEHHDTEIGRTSDGTDKNISIIGKGEAVLDGGTYNGLSEKNQLTNGLPPIWKNNLLLFTNVEGFKISNISCRNQRWWALNFIFCSNGHISDVEFISNDIAVDSDGNISHGLSLSKYADILVKNSDGIDLRQGCHNITIENITGFTEDDTVALTGLCGELEKHFAVEKFSTDIRNISVRNVSSSALCSNVRLLNQGGIRLYNILVDGVSDTSENSPYMDRGIYGVRIGDSHMYGSRHSTSDETYNITVKNVRSRGKYAVQLSGAIKNLVLENIEAFDGALEIDDTREN